MPRGPLLPQGTPVLEDLVPEIVPEPLAPSWWPWSLLRGCSRLSGCPPWPHVPEAAEPATPGAPPPHLTPQVCERAEDSEPVNLNALLGLRAINVKDKTQAMNFARNISMLKGSSGGPHGHCQMDRSGG